MYIVGVVVVHVRKVQSGIALAGLVAFSVPTLAQSVPPTESDFVQGAPINLIAQRVAPPQFIPTDLTPFTTAPERSSFSPGYKFNLFQILPERLWFNSSTEVSQRLDTNVLFTHGNYKPDYAFRVMPNVTLGYNVARNTSVYTNYFVLKDTFADHTFLNFPTTQSLSMGIQHNQRIGAKNNLQLDFQARELWQTAHLHQFDFIPGATLSRAINPNNVVFASALLQMRGKNYFVAPTRELDPFYTIGYLGRRGSWTFIATTTLVTNFRQPTFHNSVPRQSNCTMITDVEVNRPISKKVPALVAFVRAEPIWNWGTKVPGLSGFDFRLYGGLRLSMAKPAYYRAMDTLRKQIIESEATGKTGG